MTTEKLRDAIERKAHAELLLHPATEDDSLVAAVIAGAILALPEMVAAMAVVEAARVTRDHANRFDGTALIRSTKDICAAVDAYDKAVKG